MGEKKKPGRFTLQFNLEDPQQRTVSELLEQQGRHKAQFITSAVLLYVQCEKSPAVDETTLEQMLFSILEKNPTFAATVSGGPPSAKDSPTQAAPSVENQGNSMEDDAMKAIFDTLAAFRQ